RNRQEVEGLIGFFVNTLVLRSDLSGSPTFHELLGRMRRTALDAFTHQDLPFERIVEEVVTERDLAIAPLVQVLFTFQNAPLGPVEMPGLAISPVEVDAGAAQFDLALTLGEGPSGFAGSLEHNADLFEIATAERLLAAFAALLEGAVVDPGQPLADLPLFLPTERRQLQSSPSTAAPERVREPHLGPRNALELELVRLFEEVLGVPGVGVRDDFFTLGGHSLLAARLTFSLRQRLGRSLPMAAVLRHPTVEGLAALLRTNGEPPPRGPLVELAAGSGRPLFLVHPVGGEVLCYVHLARRLNRPVYGLQATDAPLKLEDMAALYLRHVREIQPVGPYLLGGWSLGGAVAYEMARQLEAQGETVERLVLIDSYAPGPLWQQDLDDRALVEMFANDLAQLSGMGGQALPHPTEDALAWLAARAEAEGLLPPGQGAAELQRRFATFAANYRAMAGYAGGPCAAPLIMVRAAESAGEPDGGWVQVAGRGVEVREIAGDHYTLLREPAVEDLATLFREHLGNPTPP
ncbi:MAG TPA: thioesterase domain-containing protein, partial [Thermoanaerobaculia bacterium]|nr:thioesterase domain-containing protein [Thermoanaerobaculia bacterium]